MDGRPWRASARTEPGLQVDSSAALRRGAGPVQDRRDLGGVEERFEAGAEQVGERAVRLRGSDDRRAEPDDVGDELVTPEAELGKQGREVAVGELLEEHVDGDVDEIVGELASRAR